MVCLLFFVCFFLSFLFSFFLSRCIFAPSGAPCFSLISSIYIFVQKSTKFRQVSNLPKFWVTFTCTYIAIYSSTDLSVSCNQTILMWPFCIHCFLKEILSNITKRQCYHTRSLIMKFFLNHSQFTRSCGTVPYSHAQKYQVTKKELPYLLYYSLTNVFLIFLTFS